MLDKGEPQTPLTDGLLTPTSPECPAAEFWRISLQTVGTASRCKSVDTGPANWKAHAKTLLTAAACDWLLVRAESQ